MKKLLLYLSLSLILISNHLSNAEEVTTGNLLDQNFDNGSWSGTADGRHGSNVIATHNDEYIVSDNVSLADDANLTQDQINDGFTTNHSFKYWHWNDYNSTVQSTVTITGADGETTTQTRTYNSTGCGYTNCGSYNTGTDSLSISRNSQTDYNINVRYDFSDTSNSTGHYGVDLKEPSLTITYESDPIRLDTSLENEIVELFEDFKPEEDIKFVKDNFTFEEKPIMDQGPTMEIVEFFEEIPMMDDFKEEDKLNESFMDVSEPEFFTEDKKEEEPMEMVMEFFEGEEKEDPPMEIMQIFEDDKKEEKPEEVTENESDSETTETADAENESDTQQEKSVQQRETKTVRLKTVLEKIDQQVKSLEKNLQLKSIVKLKVMTSNDLLDAYNIPFYKPRIIYEEQLNIQDNRDIYPIDLVEYKQNDPINQKRQRLNTILQNRQNLINELQVLTNG